MENNRTRIWQAGLLPSASACYVIQTRCEIGIPRESNRWCIWWPEKAVQECRQAPTHRSWHSTSDMWLIRCACRAVFREKKSRKFGVNLLQVLATQTSTLMVNPKHAYWMHLSQPLKLKSNYCWSHRRLNHVNLIPYQHGCLETVRMTLYLFSPTLLTCLWEQE